MHSAAALGTPLPGQARTGRADADHSLPPDVTVMVRVFQLTAEHIPSLVTRLRSYGVHSVQTRSVLHLLQTRINPAPFQIFAAGAEGADLVTVTAMQPTPDLTVLDVCGREDSACRRRLASLLRSPELARLWRRPLRVEAITEGLAPVVSSAAADHGLRRVLDDGETQRLFLRPEGLACPPRQERPGLAVRPLLPRHLPKVRRLWLYAEHTPDTDAMLRDGQAAGLSAGVFLTDPTSQQDEPVSWSAVNSYGAQAFGYTEEAYRGRGLQSMVLTELIHSSVQRGLPVFGHTTDTNAGQTLNMKLLRYAPEHITQWLGFVPSDR